jgi:RNA polymerase sigma factor (sigma-70 family)
MRFEDVYREHVTPVWRYVRLRVPSDIDAEDVTSQVFEKALRSWLSYDAGRGSLVGWLLGIARHAVADWWRKHGRELPFDRVGVEESAADDPEGDALRRLGADEVRRQLGVLTAREREAVALRFGSELTSAEIGEVLGISATAARMLVHRGVGRLRGVMTDG